MRMNNRLLIALALVILSTSSAAFGQSSYSAAGAAISANAPAAAAGVADEILKLEGAYNEAYKRGDVETIERMHAEDFRMTARGQVFDRAAFLTRFKDKSRPRDIVEFLGDEDVNVRDYGKTVVTTGRWKRTSRDAQGNDTSAEGHFTRVWIDRGAGWQLAVAHYSPLSQQPAKK